MSRPASRSIPRDSGRRPAAGTVRFLGNSKIDYSQSFGLVRFAHHPTSGSYETPDDFSGRVLTNGAWQGGPAEPTQFTAYMWVKDALDLQSIGASTATLAGNYLISGVIDAGGIENFDPIGSWGDPFTGRLVGLDATIANLRCPRIGRQCRSVPHHWRRRNRFRHSS